MAGWFIAKEPHVPSLESSDGRNLACTCINNALCLSVFMDTCSDKKCRYYCLYHSILPSSSESQESQAFSLIKCKPGDAVSWWASWCLRSLWQVETPVHREKLIIAKLLLLWAAHQPNSKEGLLSLWFASEAVEGSASEYFDQCVDRKNCGCCSLLWRGGGGWGKAAPAEIPSPSPGPWPPLHLVTLIVCHATNWPHVLQD